MRARRAGGLGWSVGQLVGWLGGWEVVCSIMLVGRNDGGSDWEFWDGFLFIYFSFTHSSMGSVTSRHNGLCWGGRRG